MVPDPDEMRLARFPLLAGAAPAAIAEAARHTRWRRAKAGEVVADFGEVTDDVFLIHSGSVRIALRTPSGQELIVGDRETGEIVGEMAAIDRSPRSANVTALHSSLLGIVPAEAFMRLVLGSPPVALRVMRLLTAHVRLDTQRLMEMAVLPVKHRLYAEMLRLAKPREDGVMRISPPPPQHVLAAKIGARREAVSRVVSAMAKAGEAMVTRQAITLPEPAKLEASIQAALAGEPGAVARARA